MQEKIQVFLSYAREDEEKVKLIYKRLKQEEFKPWMDIYDILGGERWESSIRKAIKNSNFFVACLTPNSVSKRGVLQKEIKDALEIWKEKLESDIYLIPVRLEKCNVPEGLKEFHWVDLFEDNGWRNLLKSIQEGIKRTGKHFILPNQSLQGNITQSNKNFSNQANLPIKPEDPILIVFTDEKGSTARDVQCPSPEDILHRRVSLFSNQVRMLSTKEWLVLKNVGDQLILRCDRGDSDNRVLKNKIVSCLKNLYDAWKSQPLRDRLRIAVHSPDFSEKRWASGDHLLEKLQNTFEELTTLWPSCTHLRNDIFGYEMNLAARLVTIATDALFIISEKIVKLCEEDFLREEISKWESGLSKKIPLINIKGFEEVFNTEKPFYIYEINELYK